MENPSFHLEGVVREKDELQDFEGPLSLILMLLSKNKIEIKDIKIADILDQYLEYLAEMQSMDLEIASEFIQMASHLLYIKTKTLLTAEEEVSELELLKASLEQLKARDVYASVQSVVPQLREASKKGMLYFAKLPEPMPRSLKEYNYSHEPVDLLKAMFSIYSKGGKAPDQEILRPYIPKRIIYSVKDKGRQILNLLRGGEVRLNELYRSCRTKSELVAAFMSVLELCSMGSISIEKLENDVEVDYKLKFSGGDIDEIIEKIVE
ncbi:MAG: segregation and condensation protein A [Candidatus Limivicinus sp.]|jgi:segregation and condensation protein A